MRKHLTSVFLLLLGSILFAQTPQGINFQAVARNTAGEPMPNVTGIDVVMTIKNTGGGAIYQETHVADTDECGMFNLKIGKGMPTAGQFNSINWSGGSKTLEVRVNGDLIGSQEMMSVPYALYSENTNLQAGAGITINGNQISSEWSKDNTGQKMYALNLDAFVGIGDYAPAAKLSVKHDDFSSPTPISNAVLSVEYNGGNPDAAAVRGEAISWGGLGGFFKGNNIGMKGEACGIGVLGENFCEGIGVLGRNTGGASGVGVYGEGNSQGVGVYATTGNGIALKAEPTLPGGKAAEFAFGNVDLLYGDFNSNQVINVNNYNGNLRTALNKNVGDAGILLTVGSANQPNFFVSTVFSGNNGWAGVAKDGNYKAGMYVDENGNGVLFADGASGGVKNFRMPYPSQPGKEIWYASLEGPEAAAYIRGTGTLISGEATITFTDDYQIVSNPTTMTVILTPLDADSKGMAVIEKTATGFKVKELSYGTGNYQFDWEVKCVRKGYENYRVIRDEHETQPMSLAPKGDISPIPTNYPRN